MTQSSSTPMQNISFNKYQKLHIDFLWASVAYVVALLQVFDQTSSLLTDWRGRHLADVSKARTRDGSDPRRPRHLQTNPHLLYWKQKTNKNNPVRGIINGAAEHVSRIEVMPNRCTFNWRRTWIKLLHSVQVSYDQLELGMAELADNPKY